MWQKLLIPVISSLFGALIMFVTLSAVGILDKTLTESQISSVAREFVDFAASRDVLLRKMEESGMFQGPQGEIGPQGADGEIGPEWVPILSFYQLVAEKNNPRDQNISISSKKFCALSWVGEPHAQQACICRLTQEDRAWDLSLDLDDKVLGGCYCGAVCME